MSFKTTIQGNHWTHSPYGGTKGGRREIVKKGVWVLDHAPTGRFMIGTSTDVSKEVDRMLAQLEKGKFPNKLMQLLYDKPDNSPNDPRNRTPRPPMAIIEYPIGNDRDIKRTLKEIRETNTTDYCLLN